MIDQLISHDAEIVLYNSMKCRSDVFLLCFHNISLYGYLYLL